MERAKQPENIGMKTTAIKRRAEAGVVLLIAIFVLMLVSVIAIALIVSSGTETALASNYRSSATVYYAAMAGLEEARQRLQSNSPDYFNNTIAGFMPPVGTPLTLGSVRYLINPLGAEAVVPNDPTNAYFDTEYGKEFFPTAITGVPDVEVVPSQSGTNADSIPGPVFKWVRINAVTEASLHLDVNHDSVYDSTTALYYDPKHTDGFGTTRPSLIVTASPPSSAVQALELTALAVLPNGSQKLLQSVVEPSSWNLQLPAALTLVGNGVQFIPHPSFAVNGQDQFDVGTCHAGSSAVYAVGYANASDGGSVTAATSGNISSYTGYGGTTPNVGWVGGATSPPPNLPLNEMKPSGLEQLVQQQLAQVPNAVVVTPVSGIAHNHDLPPTSAANPKTIIVNGDLDTLTETSGPNLWAGGYGILAVTGTFKYNPKDPSGSGPARWSGIILVIGQGKFLVAQSGPGEVHGAVLVATTRDAAGAVLPDSGTGTPDASLGASLFDAQQGSNGVFYSHCWIQAVLPPSSYQVLSFREIPQ
jgi:hypothetical protein